MPDHGPVEVEGDEPDRERRRGPVAAGGPSMRSGRARRAHAGDRSIRTSRGRPPRSGVTRAARVRDPLRDRLHGRVALVRADLEERDPVRPVTAAGGRSARRTTSRPSGPPSSAEVGSNASSRRQARRARRSGRTGGSRTRPRTAARRGTAAGPRRRTRIRSATPWPTAFSRASSRASSRHVDRDDQHLRRPSRRRRRAASSATAIAPVPVPTSATRSAGRPGGRGVPASRAQTSAERGVDEQLRLGPRDEGRAIGREREPVELAEAADVGDRLARARGARRRASNACRAPPPRRARPGRRRRRPVHAQRVGPAAAPRRGARESEPDAASRSVASARAARRRWRRRRPSALHPDRDVEVAGSCAAPRPTCRPASGGTAGHRRRRRPAGS